MASYETYGGNFILPHPYEVKKVTGYGVALGGNKAKLKALVNAKLNPLANQSLRYHLVSSTVLFTFMRMGRMACAGHPEMGSFSERELNVALLLVAVDGPSIRLVWYMPYLWLDSGPALIAGRDIYGFPKQSADVEIPHLGQEAKFSATAEVLHRDDGQPAVLGVILSADRVARGVLRKRSMTTKANEALATLGTFFHLDTGALANLGLTVPHLNLGSLKMVFMRQHPSISNCKRACFRSVAEVPFTVTLRSAGLLAGSYQVSIPYHHSVKLAHELGIAKDVLVPGKPGKDVTIRAKAAYHMDFDFILGKGRDLWVEYER